MKTKINLIHIFLLLLITGGFINCSPQKGYKYFDEDNNRISKSKFNRKLKRLSHFKIPGDSAHHHRLTPRLVQGTVENREMLLEVLEKAINDTIDRNVPTVIMYYPGQDAYNINTNSTKEVTANRHQQLAQYLKDSANTKPIYIYKEYTGLQKYSGVINWYKDPGQLIEKLFFRHHYPSGSFVVIDKEGTYISYKGEYALGQIVDTALVLKNKDSIQP